MKTTEIEKAYGSCHNCYGKGYSSVIKTTTGYPDFYGDKGFSTTKLEYRACTCARGEQFASVAFNIDRNARLNELARISQEGLTGKAWQYFLNRKDELKGMESDE